MNNKMSLKGFDYNLIKVFDAAVTAGNATRASQRLKISPAAVSMALKRLQVLYKEDLFIRTRHGLLPTARAIKIHRAYTQAMELIESTLDTPSLSDYPEIKIYGNEISEVFYLASLFDMKIHERFALSHYHQGIFPDEKAKDMLLTGEIDLFIGCHFFQDNDLDCLVIDRFRTFAVICSGSNPLSRIKQFSLHNFYSARHAVYHHSVYTNSLHEEKALYQLNFNYQGILKVGYRSDSVKGIINTVKNTNMIALLPEKIARYYRLQEKEDIEILKPPPELTFNALPMYAIWHRKNSKYESILEIVAVLQTISAFRK